ncbi:MAG: DNA translocase FtsK [Saccharofermentans sp.]|nr:DNA translocase FtsK [Saccharofermentans sp.]
MNSKDDSKEIVGLSLFFCAIVITLLYYLPANITGFLGEWIRGLGFGLIGSAAFMIPIFFLYAAIDFFLEKREGVAPIRIRSVIIVMICVAALFALFSMDFDYFKSLCAVEGQEDKYHATKALSLLWKSGPDSSLISRAEGSSNCLPGGLLGGGIAIALNKLAGKTISILAMFVVLLSQIILMFHVSLKQTVKKTAHAISKTATKAYRNMKSQQRPPQRQYYPPRQPVPVGNVNRRQPAVPNTARSPFVNSPTETYPVALFDKDYGNNRAKSLNAPKQNQNMERDPFARRLPVDSRTGFVDVSGEEFGADTSIDNTRLNYGTRQVSTEGAQNAPQAEFDYDALPKTRPLTPKKPGVVEPSFLRQENTQQEFYDLDNGVYPNGEVSEADNSYGEGYQQSYYEGVQDDLPYEITDDDPYDYAPERTVRRPNIIIHTEQSYEDSYENSYEDTNEDTYAEPYVAEPIAPAPVTAPAPATVVSQAKLAAVSNPITINAPEGEETGFNTDGRIIKTAEAPTPAPEITSGRIQAYKGKRKGPYRPAPLSCLAKEEKQTNANNVHELEEKARELEEALRSFGINTKVVNITHGPAITRFELTIDRGIKVSRVVSLQDDIALAMAAVSVRIEAPIPGKSAIGIEIPNKKTSAVQLRGLLETREYKEGPGLEVPLGKDIPGRPIMCNIAKMPHLLIAGSTGSGKSVCINTILTSILCKASPDDVRMILIDPKVVELSIYNDIPHLLMPVVTDPKKASNALKWAVVEMERRYKCFAESKVRDLAGYNKFLVSQGEQPLPLILIVIDELADLMTVAAKEVEDQISRLAAMARAAGLHLLIATQRPSVDVITGVIKANVPSRIAFAVSSGVDSRTILDAVGAEKLLGKGDMLYNPLSAPKPVRGQGAFVSDEEVENIVKYLKDNYGPLYDEAIMNLVNSQNVGSASAGGASGDSDSSDGEDELLDQAVNIVIEAGNASVSILQRRLGVGYPRAARLIDVLEQKHIIGPFEGSKPRKVLINKTDWLEMQSKGDS